MKTAIILFLLVLLLAVGYFTRPSEGSFRAMMEKQSAATTQPKAKGTNAEDPAAGTTFHDRYLWTSVEREGKTIYFGALAHWFDVRAVKEAGPDTGEPIRVKAPV